MFAKQRKCEWNRRESVNIVAKCIVCMHIAAKLKTY